MIEIENYYLKSTSFFDALNTGEQEYIKKKMICLEFKKRQVLFKEDNEKIVSTNNTKITVLKPEILYHYF